MEKIKRIAKGYFFLIILFALWLEGAPVFSAAPLPCKPEASNDCQLKDYQVVKDGQITLTWQNLSIRAASLPVQSWYQVMKSSDQEYHLILYPDVGDHYLLGHHDFKVEIKIKKTDRKPGPLVCTTFPSGQDYQAKPLENSNFDIEVRQGVNYFYDGGPGSNPNPFTHEVREILKKILESIRIGKC